MLKNSLESGLSSAEVEKRLAAHGPNQLPEPKEAGLLLIFARQFASPFIYILLVAGTVSLAVDQVPSAVFIGAVLLLNAGIGTGQEYSAQRSASALRNMVRGTAHVIRDGYGQTVDVSNVVPGDLVLLSSGNKVPADLKLISAQSLSVDESMLTGESLAVTKSANTVIPDDAALAERFDCCFAGTIVTHGRAQGIVSETGQQTVLGAIARNVGRRRVSEPPLMIRIRKFTYSVAGAILVAILLLAGIMAAQGGYDTEAMIMMGIGLAVSTIPEGLPAALTVALAIGMRRMARHSVIIRRLIAVEALGSCTFICSDKTGTLTVNELTLRKVVLPDSTSYEVTGEGVAPGGVVNGTKSEALEELCIAGVLANESHLDYSGGEWVSDGDIVDVAFLVFAKKLGLSLSELRDRQKQIELIPYESERAFSGSLNDLGQEKFLYAKGSPEKIVSISSSMRTAAGDVPLDREMVTEQFESLAEQGFRVLALARRKAADREASAQLADMTFLGLVAMMDPVRPEAIDAVNCCRRSEIGVAMITGDHPATARAIASQVGLVQRDDPVVDGQMIATAAAAGEAALDALIHPVRVFARIEPNQKQLVVQSFMRAGHFVAVTGDGVNDAPAMRAANAGIAMGKRGTDVAKEAADLIITDDNFASIVDGVEQGRVVYNNIRKVIALLIATGFSALLLFFFTAAAGFPMPMIAVQLLWLNLVANGLQDVALAFEPKEGNELESPPRDPAEPIFERRIIEHILVIGGAMGLLAFGVYAWLISTGTAVDEARNLTLLLMILFGNIHALSSRSEDRSLFSIKFFSNPFLVLAVPIAQLVHIAAIYTPGISDVLELRPVTMGEWTGLLAVALLLLAIEEVHKAWIRRRDGRR